jgi:hypothetical protein
MGNAPFAIRMFDHKPWLEYAMSVTLALTAEDVSSAVALA